MGGVINLPVHGDHLIVIIDSGHNAVGLRTGPDQLLPQGELLDVPHQDAPVMASVGAPVIIEIEDIGVLAVPFRMASVVRIPEEPYHSCCRKNPKSKPDQPGRQWKLLLHGAVVFFEAALYPVPFLPKAPKEGRPVGQNRYQQHQAEGLSGPVLLTELQQRSAPEARIGIGIRQGQGLCDQHGQEESRQYQEIPHEASCILPGIEGKEAKEGQNAQHRIVRLSRDHGREEHHHGCAVKQSPKD